MHFSRVGVVGVLHQFGQCDVRCCNELFANFAQKSAIDFKGLNGWLGCVLHLADGGCPRAQRKATSTRFPIAVIPNSRETNTSLRCQFEFLPCITFIWLNEFDKLWKNRAAASFLALIDQLLLATICRTSKFLAVKKLVGLCLISFSLTAVAQTYLEQFPLHQKTRYFDFYYRRDPQKIAYIARFADGFIKVINRDFFKADFDYPIRTLVLEDRATFQGFLCREFRISDPPAFGVYISSQKLFATYENSGLGTFAHEIMHPLIERNLPDHPMWALEGIPSFFEKFHGYWTNDELVTHWGYQNPWRIAQLGTNLTQLDLKRLISNPQQPREVDESAVRMVSMFLWDQGKFKRFLAAIAAKDRGGFNTYFEAAMGESIDQTILKWQAYLKNVEGERSAIMRLPSSVIFPDEASFRNYASAHKLPLSERDQNTAPFAANPSVVPHP